MNTRTTEGAAPACERVRSRLDELLDGGLPPLQAARDEGHLEACAACAHERERRARWLAEVRSALLPGPDELALAGRGLEARLAAARPPRRTAFVLLTGSGPRRATVAASLAASALLALALLRGLGAVDLPLEEVLGGSLRSMGTGSLPALEWPSDPEQIWRER